MSGFGDALIATGLAKGAKTRGKRIALGDRRRILWKGADQEIFRGNPNLAPPGQERASDIEWIEYYAGHRQYADYRAGRWRFNKFQCPPGEVFFTKEEIAFGKAANLAETVVIEPHVKARGACDGVNKQWPVARYQQIADELQQRGYLCAQFVSQTRTPLLRNIRNLHTPNFRHAMAALSHAALYLGPEGGLHHGAAAVGVNAVVIFGGFNSPQSTGYNFHHNIAVGEPCGKSSACPHCQVTMRSISVDTVLKAVLSRLS